MAGFLMYMRGLRPTNKIGAAFGSYGWSGEAVKLMNEAMEEMKFDVIERAFAGNTSPTTTASGNVWKWDGGSARRSRNRLTANCRRAFILPSSQHGRPRSSLQRPPLCFYCLFCVLCRSHSLRIKDKRAVQKILQHEDLAAILRDLADMPAAAVINPLFSGICNANQIIRWHAITAMGVTLARLADQDMESTRIVMRRFMWSLNDESGGIGWGAPEAMAEAMLRHERLAEEYCHILVAFMREEGFYLEYPPLQYGLLWGLGRLAGARAELLLEKKADRYLGPYLREQDETVRGLAAYALATLGSEGACRLLRDLTTLPTTITVYSPEQDRHLDLDLPSYIAEHCPG